MLNANPNSRKTIVKSSSCEKKISRKLIIAKVALILLFVHLIFHKFYNTIIAIRHFRHLHNTSKFQMLFQTKKYFKDLTNLRKQ